MNYIFVVFYLVAMLYENKIKSYRNRKMVFKDTERSFYGGPTYPAILVFLCPIGANRRGSYQCLVMKKDMARPGEG